MLLRLVDAVVVPVSVAIVTRLAWDMLAIDPYMDEIFHVPQARLICYGDFVTWDAKITTFPGLYYASCTIGYALNQIGYSSTNFPVLIRAINFFFALVLLMTATMYWRRIHGKHNTTFSCIIPSIAFCFPISSFYYGLFYTDTLSTTSVLLLLLFSAYVAQDPRRNVFSELILGGLASAAIFCRQTNVLWVLFAAGTICASKFYSQHSSSSKMPVVIDFVVFLLKNVVAVVGALWSLIIPIMAFGAFVIANGGIVVGDKDNHKPTVHFAMLSHCLAISGVLCIPGFISSTLHARPKAQGTNAFSWTTCLLVSLVVSCGMTFGSLSHPFLLSDNRHLSFYLWRKVLSHPQFRLALTPVYTLLIALFFRETSKRESFLWLLIYVIATSLALLPTPLLEFRYFTVPVLIGFLHSNKELEEEPPAERSLRVFLQIGIWSVFVGLNVVLIHVFLHRTFIWPDGSLARFML